MPVDDLGYDVAPVDGNPFGAMADSPNNYDVQAVEGDPFTPAYHGTTAQFDEFSSEPSETYMPDRMLGHHFAADPAVSNAFVMDRYNEAEHGVKPGGRVIPVNLPPASNFLNVPQPQHDWAREEGQPVSNRNIATDQTSIAKLIAQTAYPQRPDYLARSLQDNLALPEDEAHATAAHLIQGGTVSDGGRDYTLEAYLNNRQGAFPYDSEMKRDMARIARQSWQNQGYKGLRYTNTSPMETMPEAGVKDPTSYVVFDPKDAAPRFGSPLMAPQLVAHPGYNLHDPYGKPPIIGERSTEWAGGRVGYDDGGAIDGDDESSGIGSDARYPQAPPLGWNAPPLDPGDRDALIKTIYGEASDQPALGQAGVAHAILNRVRAGGYGQGISGVVKAPAAGVNPRFGYHEFSPWNPPGVPESNPAAQNLSPKNPAYASIGSIVDKVYKGDIPDPTYGATHYYGRMRGVPKWSPPLAAQNLVKIGDQTFVGGASGPGQALTQTASGYASGGPVQLNGELRRRLALLTRPRHGLADGGTPDDQDAAGFAALDKMTGRADRVAEPPPPPAQASNNQPIDPETGLPSFDPATNVPREPQTPVIGGQWGKAAELGYEDITGALGSGMNWAGDKFEQGVGKTAAAVGVPGATGLARDLRAMLESGEGTSGLHKPPTEMPIRYNHPSFPEGRIATRVPTAVGPLADNAHLSNDAKIDLDTMRGQTGTYAKTAAIGRQMPFEPTPDGNGWVPTNQLNFPPEATANQIHEGWVNHFKSNILALHDAVADHIRPGSQRWYDGANSRAQQQALRYNKPLENIAGAYAAMSPKMDWFQNVSLSDRVMDIVHNQSDTPFTPEMNDWVNRRYGNATSAADLAAKNRFANIGGSTINQLADPLDKAHWVRAFDEAHNSRDYNIVNPDGTFATTATTDKGANAKVAWGNGYKPIAKAITAFTAPDMPTISGAMGNAHKVRSFYNNIVAPMSQHGDVTVDTHAIAAGLLRPLSGDAKDVSIGLGTAPPSNAQTGAQGLYGAYVEAYRRAAAERNILPRQMQSITWEALRGLWNPEEKANAAINANVRNVWSRFRNGEIDQPTAQRLLMTHPETGASLIKSPDWHTAGWRP